MILTGSAGGCGSSPLTRGKLHEQANLVANAGLIPAHAGKTAACLPQGSDREAHPRSRGENRAGVTSSQTRAGSSPLTRGKLELPAGPCRRVGLIPAHAGKTTVADSRAERTWAHPRSRGENSLLTPMLSDKYGSSPLTRGKPGAGIPLRWPDRAHPRSRGENDHAACTPRGCSGSSPLTRGKPNPTHDARNRSRLIPAHAGKTLSPRRRREPTGAHPRSRGENQADRFVMSPHEGSSPLTRGKH